MLIGGVYFGRIDHLIVDSEEKTYIPLVNCLTEGVGPEWKRVYPPSFRFWVPPLKEKPCRNGQAD